MPGLVYLDPASSWKEPRLVDTGLQKWTRQQAIDYGIQQSEVDRFLLGRCFLREQVGPGRESDRGERP